MLRPGGEVEGKRQHHRLPPLLNKSMMGHAVQEAASMTLDCLEGRRLPCHAPLRQPHPVYSGETPMNHTYAEGALDTVLLAISVPMQHSRTSPLPGRTMALS